MHRHLLLACVSALCALTAAAGIKERVAEINAAYSAAIEQISYGAEDLNQLNNVVVTRSENLPGSGPSAFTTEYYFRVTDGPEGQRQRQLYLIRNTQQYAARRYTCDYLIDPATGQLMYLCASEPDLNGDSDAITTQVFFDKAAPTKPLRLTRGNVSTDTPTLDAEATRRVATFAVLLRLFPTLLPPAQ